MIDSDLDSAVPIFDDRWSSAKTACIALIAEDEFASAQRAVPDLAAYADYEEWRETREGFEMGLAMAGVAANLVPIGLSPFLAWTRRNKRAPSEGALNDFAAAISPLRLSSEPVAEPELAVRELPRPPREIVGESAGAGQIYEPLIDHCARLLYAQLLFQDFFGDFGEQKSPPQASGRQKVKLP